MKLLHPGCTDHLQGSITSSRSFSSTSPITPSLTLALYPCPCYSPHWTTVGILLTSQPHHPLPSPGAPSSPPTPAPGPSPLPVPGAPGSCTQPPESAPAPEWPVHFFACPHLFPQQALGEGAGGLASGAPSEGVPTSPLPRRTAHRAPALCHHPQAMHLLLQEPQRGNNPKVYQLVTG